jgi:hypothetical protein
MHLMPYYAETGSSRPLIAWLTNDTHLVLFYFFYHDTRKVPIWYTLGIMI